MSIEHIQTQKSAEHGTPQNIVEAARHTLGGFDLDPASSKEFNKFIKAKKFFTEEDDGLGVHTWGGRVFLNPPGGQSGAVVKQFWGRLVASHEERFMESAIWVGFNIGQLQQLQNTDIFSSPLDYPICIPRKRISFVDGATMSVKSQPVHSNYITLLPDGTHGQLRRFEEAFGEIGSVRI